MTNTTARATALAERDKRIAELEARKRELLGRSSETTGLGSVDGCFGSFTPESMHPKERNQTDFQPVQAT